MQTLTLEQFERGDRTLVEDLAQNWRVRLSLDCPEFCTATKESIICWLLGDDSKQYDLNTQMEITQKAMLYRYRILRQRSRPAIDAVLGSLI